MLIKVAIGMQYKDSPWQVQDGISNTLYMIFTICTWVALCNKRLHDFGWSGWWSLPIQFFWFLAIVTIPFAIQDDLASNSLKNIDPAIAALAGGINLIAFLTLIPLGFKRGNPGPNRYGPPPGDG